MAFLAVFTEYQASIDAFISIVEFFIDVAAVAKRLV